MFRFKKLLVPLDGSEFAEGALDPAMAIARGMQAEVVLFRVAEPIPRTRALAEMPDVYNDVVAAAYRDAEEYLTRLKTRLDYERITVEHRSAEEGVARQLLDYAAQASVDLIVMTSHGRTGVDRWVHGSVAEKVLGSCACATLILRGPRSDD
jgi:nucleotide-binding universal stress UspA family protein